jgi:hypothetical protein
MDEIEFRHGSGRYNEPVRVVINGTPLTELWRAAGQRSAAPISTAEVGEALEWWGPGNSHPDGYVAGGVPDGFAPVLTCTCGEFGCGGAIVRIQFETWDLRGAVGEPPKRRVVRWTDFKTANYEEPVPLGPFVFSRTAYERARRAFSLS